MSNKINHWSYKNQKPFKSLYTTKAICGISNNPLNSALDIVLLPLIEDILHSLETSNDFTIPDFNTKRK